MSRLDKLRGMEVLEEEQLESAAWHEDALREAEVKVQSGRAKFSDWAEAKKRLQREATKLP